MTTRVATARTLTLARGTPDDLVGAAELRGRMAARRHHEAGASAGTGCGDDEIIRRVIGEFRAELEAESFGVYEDESLMAAIQRGARSVLDELSAC